jgi:hypothetical protein
MSTPLYVRFTSDATEMTSMIGAARQKLRNLGTDLKLCNLRLRSMAPELCRLGATPDEALDRFIQLEYTPMLEMKKSLAARRNNQEKLVENMRKAMREDAYHTDVMAQLAKRVERTRLETTQCSEETLINAAKAVMTEAEIREKIRAGRVEPNERTMGSRPTAPQNGDIVWIRENTGGRSWAVDWRMQSIVLGSGIVSDGITLYAVCFLDPDCNAVKYRLVMAENMLSQTNVPV